MEFIKALLNADKSKENIVITIVSGKNINSKLILSDGEIIYSNNDKVNWEPIINNIPTNKKSQLISLNNQKIYIEFLSKKSNVVVCGAGHISISIIKMCKLLDLHVTVIDDRIKFTNNAKMAEADKVICDSFDNALDKITGHKGTYFIIVTRGHRYDQTCLEKIIEKENAYIGMNGSKVRVRKVLNYIEEQGVPREKLDKVYTPIGLNIGAETPTEIAVAIMAQLIEVKNKGIGSSNYDDELLNSLMDEKLREIPKALVTIVSRRSSAPREVGTKMFVLKDGTIVRLNLVLEYSLFEDFQFDSNYDIVFISYMMGLVNENNIERILHKARQHLILVMPFNRIKNDFSVDELFLELGLDLKKLEQLNYLNILGYLNKKNIKYDVIKINEEFGQPFNSFEEVVQFVNHYFKIPLEKRFETIEWLKRKVTKLDKKFYLPNMRESAVIII